jgi:NRAMP (natural resistance-associated macrophage protein)-like metal ion transporter
VPEAPPEGKPVKRRNILGAGLITGAAGDDPSGIATYSQTGAQFGFALLWTSIYQIPLLLAVQECCARIGSVTGMGLSGVIRRHHSRPVLLGLVSLLVIANVINIGADIGAIAAAEQLVAAGPFWSYAVGTTLLVVLLEVFVTYRIYSRILKGLALALFSYPVTALIIDAPWSEVLKATLIPHLQFTYRFAFIITAVLGTSISPYMFFWQASEEVEEERLLNLPLGDGGQPELPVRFIRNLRIDTSIGMIASELIQWFIILTTGYVLFSHGVTTIKTAADAALALEPLVHSFPNAGQIARDLFAVGVIGLGFLAIPVLAGSSAYAMAEAFGWKEGLSLPFSQAKGFYGVIIVSTAAGLAGNALGIDPIRALVFAAVVNGVAAAPLVLMLATLNGNAAVLGVHRGGLLSRFFVWLTFVVMAASSLALLYALF